MKKEVAEIERSFKEIRKRVYSTMETLMDDVESGSLRLDELDDEAYIRQAVVACYLVDIEGGVHNTRIHYFRNNFWRAPLSLEEMTETIRGKPQDPFGWRLLPPGSTFFHMAGPAGEYNLKFISADGHFEAVYNRQGLLLTRENNPTNMGTFNYADPATNHERHAKYDVLPYLKWRNTPGGPPLPRSLEEDMKKKFTSNRQARERYEQYRSLLAPAGS